MPDALKALAVEWQSPGGTLSLWLLPFTTLRVNNVYDAFAEIVPREQWAMMHYCFANMDTFLYDVKIKDGATSVERVFALLWEHRADPLADRWVLFQEVFSDNLYRAFDMAYDATRDHTYDAPEPVASATRPDEDADPES